MKNLPIIVAGFVTILLCITFIPPFVMYLIGCFQVGTWIGGFFADRMED